MRILYGVSGEGSGHSSRALEIGRYLLGKGHELRMVSYDRGARNLQGTFRVIEIEGLHIVSRNNRVRPVATLWHNFRRVPSALRRLRALRQELGDFSPEVVITDFEPVTAWLAKIRGWPLISLDNQHRMRYMHYQSPLRLMLSRLLTESIIRIMVPSPDVALATTFYQGEVKNNFTFLFPPILRREVLACQPSEGRHHLVYVTSVYEQLVDILSTFSDQQFVVYGSGKQGRSGNLHFKPFSAQGFLHDLASCRSVIATAGFTLISEALYLGKPYLALPMQGQFEQQLNALCLAELGYGVNAGSVNQQVIRDFFARLPALSIAARDYSDHCRLADPEQANAGICSKLDELLAAELPGSGAAHWQR
jgi:uncharacterized protein (TIGR00661 family)